MEEHALVSLSILKANLEEGQTYLDNFVPFALEAIWSAPDEPITLNQIQGIIRNEFGLNLPQGVLRVILRRASRLQYVIIEQKTYRRNSKKKPTRDFASARDSALRQYKALIEKLIKFSTPLLDKPLDREEADHIFLEYITKNSASILSSDLQHKSTDELGSSHNYVLNRFIVDLDRSDPSGFGFLETVVKGSMLADALYLQDVDHISSGFKELEVYFDTRILLHAMGFEGDRLKGPHKDLIDMVYRQKGTPCCFDHTVDEIYRVLDGAAHTLSSASGLKQSHGGVFEYFLSSDYNSSDVHLLMSRLPKILAGMRIKIKSAPKHIKMYGLNESKLQETLKISIRYRKDEALFHDIDSISSIYRLRKGQFPRYLESSNAVFVTTNTSLVEACVQFLKEEYGGASAFIPVCISDYAFTTITWLKSPTDAPELPRKRIIADCFAALNPTHELWNKYLEQINNLRNDNSISSDDYYLLRLSSEARQLFMDITFGHSEAFVEGTVLEVLERARAAIRADTEDELKTEEKRRFKAEEQLKIEQRGRLADKERMIEKIESFSTHLGRITTHWIPYFVAAAAILGFILTMTDLAPISNGWSPKLIPLIFYGLLSLISTLFGSNIFSLGRRAELWVAKYVKHKLLQYLLHE